MTIRISKIYKRPDTSIPWHFEILDSTTYVEQFVTVHLINCTLNERKELDDLRIQFIVEWNSEEACQAYWDDPILKEHWQIRDEYNQIVGITSEDRVVEHI